MQEIPDLHQVARRLNAVLHTTNGLGALAVALGGVDSEAICQLNIALELAERLLHRAAREQNGLKHTAEEE